MMHTAFEITSILRQSRVTNRPAKPLLRVGLRQALTIIFCCLIVWPATIAAQNIQNPQDSVDFKRRSQATVDPATLALQLQIPLGNYRGRGDMSFPITLNYSSKLWRVGYARSDAAQSGGDPKHIFHGFYGESSAAGWTSSLDWFLWPTINGANGQTHFYGFERQKEMYEIDGRPSTDNKYERTVARMHVVLPDGSRHELRRDDTVLPAGADTTSGTFLAVDGSRLRFESASRTLFIPDGSRIIYDPNPDGTPAAIRYVDRHGNQNTYSFATTQCDRWTDSLGRKFNVDLLVRCDGNPGIEAGDKTYTLPGAGGTPLAYTLRWRPLYGPNGETVLDVPINDETQRPYIGDHTDTGSHSPLSPSLFNSFEDSLLTSDDTRFNPVVLAQIVLPNGTAYTFKYNTYGEIVRVELPTGGYETFSYAPVESLSGHIDAPLYAQANRGVVAHTASAGPGELVSTWTYGTTINTEQETVKLARTIKAPDDSCTVILYHKSLQDGIKWGFDKAIAGKPYDERVYAQCPSPNGEGGVLLRRKLIKWVWSGPIPADNTSPAERNPRVEKEAEITFDTSAGALSTVTSYTYDGDLNVTSATKHAYVIVDPAIAVDIAFEPDGDFDDTRFDQYLRGQNTAVATTEMTYLVNDTRIDASQRAAYRARNLIALPTSKIVHQGELNGAIAARTEMSYDEDTLLPCTETTRVDPNTPVRGNATSTSSLADISANRFITTRAQYDECGNVRITRDGKGKRTEIQYSTAFGSAYPTHTSADPDGDGGPAQPLTTDTAYDFSSGLVTSTTDANGQLTAYEYNDALNRLKKVTRPSGGGSTTYDYGDTPGNLFIQTKTALDASRFLTSTKYFDGLGRSVRAVQSEGATSIFTDTIYDVMGRVWKVSNPYRTGTPLLTVNAYDKLGRIISLTTPDGAQVLTAYNAVPGSTATGMPVMVTDQAGRKRGSMTDALGRLIQVVEDPQGLNHLTNYEYDVLGNLRTVSQGEQTRSFNYDPLSRLQSASNPESGTISYQYDDNGNLVLKVDARGVRTLYTYDDMNRVLSRRYENDPASTPGVFYYYDAQALPGGAPDFDRGFSKGRLVATLYGNALDAAGNNLSTMGTYLGYDALGRVKRSIQRTNDGQAEQT
ncbi:MAG TPA: hypothetical protein VF544_20985, partial [Pyrinomonadaceae bacterium]